MIVLKIIIKKCIEEKINNTPNTVDRAISNDNARPVVRDNWLDIEQSVFNIMNSLINKRPSKISFPYIYFHCAHIYEILSSQANQIDTYVDIEKNLLKIEDCLRNLKDPMEIKIFLTCSIRMLAEFFNKINTTINSIERITLIIDLIFLPLIEQKDILNITFEKLKHSIKSLKTNFYKLKEKPDTETTDREENFTFQKAISQIKENLDCFFYYILRFTNDITNGKKIWYILENQIIKRTNSEKVTNRIIDLSILYVLGRSRYLKYNATETDKKQIILATSTILEFISDKFFNAKVIIPLDKNEYIENHAVTLFSEIICNYTDLLPYNYLSNESFIDVIFFSF